MHLTVRNLSANTVRIRRTALRKLLAFLGAKDLTDVAEDDLAAYRLHLVEQGFSDHAAACYLHSARAFFAYLEHAGRIFASPAAALRVPKVRSALGSVLTDDQLRALFESCELTRPDGLRDRAILETAYAAALRVAELTGIALASLKLSERTVRVLGKGRKERVTPLTALACQFLERYLEAARPRLLDGRTSDALWISCRTGGAFTADGLAQMLRRRGESIRLPFHLTCHVIRRTTASSMLRNGAHPESLRILLGHADFKSLSQYLAISIPELRAMHGRSKPGQ